MVGGIPYLNDLSVGALRGDDAYYLGRAIRARRSSVHRFFSRRTAPGRRSFPRPAVNRQTVKPPDSPPNPHFGTFGFPLISFVGSGQQLIDSL